MAKIQIDPGDFLGKIPAQISKLREVRDWMLLIAESINDVLLEQDIRKSTRGVNPASKKSAPWQHYEPEPANPLKKKAKKKRRNGPHAPQKIIGPLPPDAVPIPGVDRKWRYLPNVGVISNHRKDGQWRLMKLPGNQTWRVRTPKGKLISLSKSMLRERMLGVAHPINHGQVEVNL